MVNFDKISWKQILAFCRVLQNSSISDLSIIKRRFSEDSFFFDDILELFLSLDLVRILNNKIVVNSSLKKIISSNNRTVRNYFIEKLFQKKSNLYKYLGDFFDNFEKHKDKYIFIPNIHERVKYSGVRNFLISLKVLNYDPTYDGYIASPRLLSYLKRSNKILSYPELLKQIKSKEELGYSAERLIFKMERDKFKNKPRIQKKICHIALENVKAGYDIKSFEINSTGILLVKFIEVKVVSEDDYRFYWTKNEIAKAIKFGRRYYLYLVPVKKDGTLNTSNLIKINDPYKKIYKNEVCWKREIELFSFTALNNLHIMKSQYA